MKKRSGRAKSSVAVKPSVTLVRPMDYDALLGCFSDKDRSTFERQLATFELKQGAAPAQRWKRLAQVLMTLAPNPAKISSGHAMQFYIPDGKYRKQVFALHGLADGTVAVYAPDVLAEAISEGFLRKTSDEGNQYRLPDFPQTLEIEPLDGKTPNPDPVYKDMTGWNRKAIRLNLPPSATEEQLAAVEYLCNLAAADWAGASVG